MTYIFGDLNNNEVLHEMMISPAGDVPPFFTWEAFRTELVEIYGSFGDHSPHSELIAEHVGSLDLDVEGALIDTYLAYLDAVPRIPDVMFEIADDYDRLVVVPMLLASSTHTQEVATQVEESAREGAEIIVVDPFYEVPFMRDRVATAVVATADYLQTAVPADTAESDIGILIVAHGTPYLPPEPAFGWQEGEIYSHLTLIEDEFHEELAAALPYPVKTGRMNYAEPSIAASLAEFEAEGIDHVLVVPSAFPTAAMHTMWDVADAAIGRAVTPDEGVVVHTRDSGMTVYYSAEGYADFEPGRQEFRTGLEYLAESGVRQVLGLEADPST
jgi:protoheme ferro-lyase